MEKWTERFQCLRGTPEDKDPIVQVFFKRAIQGHALEGLEEHKIKLSQLPFLNELLDPEHVEKLEKASQADTSIPAAGRTVPINHNSAAYREADEALEDLEKALSGSNDQEKNQAHSEISAARRLLQSTQVRAWALVAVLGPPLTYLSKKAMDVGISKLATIAWEKVIALVGAIF